MTFFTDNIVPILATLAPVAVPILLAYLTVIVRSAFDRMPSKQRALLAGVVQTGVSAAEQSGVLGKLTGPEKEIVAMRAIDAQLAHFGLKVPDSVIKPMLEEAVLVVNMARGETSSATTPVKG